MFFLTLNSFFSLQFPVDTLSILAECYKNIDCFSSQAAALIRDDIASATEDALTWCWRRDDAQYSFCILPHIRILHLVLFPPLQPTVVPLFCVDGIHEQGYAGICQEGLSLLVHYVMQNTGPCLWHGLPYLSPTRKCKGRERFQTYE
jgi:hypothetical protein